jgi:hypothetical protein
MQNPDPRTAGQYQTMMVLWAALLMSQFLFVLLIFITRPKLFTFPPAGPLLGENALIVLALGLAALTSVAVSFFLRKQNVERGIATQNVGLIQSGLITGCVLCEVSSLLGVVLAFAFNYQYFFLWIALGIFGMLLHFPRRGDIEAANFKKV